MRVLKFEIVECRQLLGGAIIVEILATVVAQILAYSFSRIITTKFLWQIAARVVSNKWKVPSCGIPPLRALLQVMTK